MMTPEQGFPMLNLRSVSRKTILPVAALVFASCTTAAVAGERASATPRMPLGASAAPPSGFLDFCRRSPGDCAEPGQRADRGGIRARASSLYWSGVFDGATTRPASTGYDWSRVFPQRETASVAVVDPMRAGEAVSMEDAARPAVETAQTAPTPRTDWALSADDHGSDVAARVPTIRPRLVDRPKASAAAVMTLDKTGWKTLGRLNRQVNRSIRSSSDQRLYGVGDFWAVPTGANARGDCEDYVLAKRRALIDAGYPAGALSIAIAETRWGETHAVLLVATDTGDFVLDSLTQRISRWDRTGYKWHERQAPGSVFDWVRMAG